MIPDPSGGRGEKRIKEFSPLVNSKQTNAENHEGELAFIILLKSQAQIGGAGWLLKVSHQQWLEKAFKTRLHRLCAITNLTLSKQEFSAATREARTFRCLHYRRPPSWLLVKKKPPMTKTHYITVMLARRNLGPVLSKRSVIYWLFSQFSIEKPTSGKAAMLTQPRTGWGCTAELSSSQAPETIAQGLNADGGGVFHSSG